MGEIIGGVLCAMGLGLAAWWLFGRLLRPIPSQRLYGLIPGAGDGKTLEQSVRAFVWLRGLGLLDCPIVIADVGLSARGRELALRLTLRWPEVILWPAGELGDYISRR